MSEKIKILYCALWIAHPVLQTVIAIAMFRRGQHRVFKYFFAYIVTQILTFVVLFPASRYNYFIYFYFSWFSTAVSVALGFQVIHEAFLDAFRPFHTLRDLGTVLFKWAGLVMLLVAGVVSVSTNSSDTPPWIQAILTAQRCVRIIQVGMVLFLLSFARYLGVSRRQHSFGIALGFGTFAVVELALIASWAGNHLAGLSVDLVNMGAYNCTLLIWLGYMLAKSPAREAGSMLLRPQRWEQGLSDIHHPLPADSLIPMFEGMVDRALSRTQGAPSTSTQEVATNAKSAAAHAGGASTSGLGFSGLANGFAPKK
ncbi:MAG: hypothetical protein ABSH02_00955 [Candidatus Sulfotelmatobacter sp.]|jgi:hypothetical protein